MNSRFLPLLALLGITSRIDSDDAAIDAAVDALQKRKDAADRAEKQHKDALDAATTEWQAKLDALQAQHDAEKARADKAEAELEKLQQAEAERADAEERAALAELAKGLGVDVEKHDSASALRRAVAEAHLGQAMRADASDDYVRAVVDLAKARTEKRGDGRSAGQKAWQPGTTTTTDRTDGDPQPRPRSSTMRDRWSGHPVGHGGDK